MYISLIDPNVKNYIMGQLQLSHTTKIKYYNIYFNVILAILLILIVGLILLFMYKGKLSPLEKAKKKQQDKLYILSKISKYNIENKNKTLITDLPKW